MKSPFEILRAFTELAAVNQLVLFGFSPNLAAHLERSSLNHSYRYASADDRPSCFSSSTLNPKPFMQYEG